MFNIFIKTNHPKDNKMRYPDPRNFDCEDDYLEAVAECESREDRRQERLIEQYEERKAGTWDDY